MQLGAGRAQDVGSHPQPAVHSGAAVPPLTLPPPSTQRFTITSPRASPEPGASQGNNQTRPTPGSWKGKGPEGPREPSRTQDKGCDKGSSKTPTAAPQGFLLLLPSHCGVYPNGIIPFAQQLFYKKAGEVHPRRALISLSCQDSARAELPSPVKHGPCSATLHSWSSPQAAAKGQTPEAQWSGCQCSCTALGTRSELGQSHPERGPHLGASGAWMCQTAHSCYL